MPGPTAKIFLRLEDLTGEGLKSAEGKLKSFGKSVSGIGKKMSLFVTGPIAAMGALALKNAADFEKQTVAFETMLGSAEKARDLLEDIVEFSAKTPFQLPDLQEGAKRLLGFGIEADKVVDTLRDLGNAAQGDQTRLDRLTLAFGKLRAKGKATLEELNMFLEAGVPILDELARMYDVNTQEMFEMISQGKIGFADVEEALTNLTTGTGQFAGMLEKQSKTLGGLLSTLKDNIGLLGMEIMQTIMPAIKEWIEKGLNLVRKLREMDDSTKKLILKIVGLMAAIGPLLLVIGTFSMVLGAILSPIGLVITAIAALGTAAFLLWKNWKEVSQFLVDLWNDLADFCNKIFQNMKLAVLIPIREVLEFLLKVGSAIKTVFKGLDLEGLSKALATINTNINETYGKIDELGPSFKKTGDHLGDFGEKIKKLAEKITKLAGTLKGIIIDGIDVGGTVKEVADAMDKMGKELEENDKALQKTDEEMQKFGETIFYTKEQSDGLIASEYYMRIGQGLLNKEIKEYNDLSSDQIKIIYNQARAFGLFAGEIEDVGDEQEELRDATEQAMKIFPMWSNAWATMGDTGMTAAEKLKEASKDLFSGLLMMLSKEALIRAFMALAKLQFGRAALWFTASATAATAAGFVRSLAQGGEFTTNGPQLLMVGDNPSGRERVRVEPLNQGQQSFQFPSVVILDIEGHKFRGFLRQEFAAKNIPVYRGAITDNR